MVASSRWSREEEEEEKKGSERREAEVWSGSRAGDVREYPLHGGPVIYLQ